MNRRIFAWVTGLALALGSPGFAAPDSPNSGKTQVTGGQEKALTGVLTRIDTGKRMLTVVAPAGTEVDVTNIGKTVFVDHDVNLVSVQAPIAGNAQIWRDGQQVKLSSLKEGDVVRTSFDPAKASFEGVAAVSSKQIDQDVSQAQTQLKQELKSQLSPKDEMNKSDTNKGEMNKSDETPK